MILALAAIFALSALSLVWPVGKGPIVPHPPAIEFRKAPGGVLQADTSDTATAQWRSFFFSSGAIGEVGNEFVITTDRLIIEIINMLPSTATFENIDRVNVITNRELVRAGSVFSPWEDGVTITRCGQNTMGWLTHAISGSRLPMWLSVGIEAVARCNLSRYARLSNNLVVTGDAHPNCSTNALLHENAADGGQCTFAGVANHSRYGSSHDIAIIESFGDLLFVPVWGRAGQARQAEAISMAYHFTRFLIDEGYFADLVEYYMDENRAAAESLSAAAFYSFAGSSSLSDNLDTTRVARQGYSTNASMAHHRLIISQGPDYAYAIAIQTDMAAYRFVFDSFNQGLAPSIFSAYVDYMDDGILFAVEWYRAWVDFDFYPMEVYVFYRQSERNFYAEAIYPWLINIYEIGNFPPTSISHEASHLLTTRVLHDHGYIFTPFDEGLAFAIMAYHGIHDRFNHGFEYQFRRGREPISTWRLNRMVGRNGAPVVRNIVDEFDIIGLFHMYAYLEHGGYIDGISLNFWSHTDRLARQYADIDSIGTFGKAASFVLYLIEAYGAEAYMQVHFDLARFEYVYGAKLHKRIESWLVFLRDFMDIIVP